MYKYENAVAPNTPWAGMCANIYKYEHLQQPTTKRHGSVVSDLLFLLLLSSFGAENAIYATYIPLNAVPTKHPSGRSVRQHLEIRAYAAFGDQTKNVSHSAVSAPVFDVICIVYEEGTRLHHLSSPE